MQVQVDLNELRYAAGCFSSGAYELRQKAKRVEDILNGLIQGKNSWSGEASQAFSAKMEKLHSELQQKAGILDEAVQILNQFALHMDHVNQLRNQANQLEHTLWSITGDSEAAFHERQSISFQINQLHQEAEWQANAADAQALSAFNSLSIPMPDFNVVKVVPKAPANEPWYDRVTDWFKEQGHEFVVAYEKHWTTGNIWYDELDYWTLGIPDQVEKVFHTKPFSLENLEANLELFISVVPATKAESVALDGVKVASNAAEEKMTEQEAINDEKTLGSSKYTYDSITQGATSAEKTDVSKGMGNRLETKGYRPEPGERTMTREEWEALDRERRIEVNYPKPTVIEKDYELVKSNAKYYTPEGDIIWPPNRGVLGEPETITLSPGTIIDRFGYEAGTFVSPYGVPYEMRALAPETYLKPYNVYVVKKPIEVKAGKIAPWFDESGLGIQYELNRSVKELVNLGIIGRVGE